MPQRAQAKLVVRDTLGAIIASASVTVRQRGTTTSITETIYGHPTDNVILANPLTADAQGRVEFWLANPLRVDILVTSGATTRTIRDVDVLPPAEQLDTIAGFNESDLPSRSEGTLVRVLDGIRGLWSRVLTKWVHVFGRAVDPVRDFGAVADGSSHPLSERYATVLDAQAAYPGVTRPDGSAIQLTDTIDWIALQASLNAVKALPRGGAIFIPANELVCNHRLNVKDVASGKPITIFGVGHASKLNFVNASFGIVTNNSDDITIRDLTVTGTNLTRTIDLIDGTNIVVQGCAISGATSFAAGGVIAGVNLDQVTESKIIDNIFTGIGDSAQPGHASSLNVYINGRNGNTSKNLVRGNRILNAHAGNGVQVNDSPDTDVVENYVDMGGAVNGNGTTSGYGILIYLTAFGESINGAANCKAISNTVKNCAAFGVAMQTVPNGIVASNVVEDACLDVDDTGLGQAAISVYSIQLDRPAICTGNTINGSGKAGINLQGDGTICVNNEIRNCPNRGGIVLRNGARGAVIAGNQIANCQHGITTWNNSMRVQGARIVGNVVERCTGSGINIADGWDCDIADNRLRDITSNGIHAGGRYHKIHHNTVVDALVGIQTPGGSPAAEFCVVDRNTVRACRAWAINDGGLDNRIENNDILFAGATGKVTGTANLDALALPGALELLTLKVAVDGGAEQTITFSGITFPEFIAAIINVNLQHAVAHKNSAGNLVIASERGGTTSSIVIGNGTANTALGLSNGQTGAGANPTSGFINRAGTGSPIYAGNRERQLALRGTATLVNGFVSISNIEVRTGDRIRLVRKTPGSAPGHLSYVVVNQSGIQISSSSASDNGDVDWEIVH